MKEIRFCKVNEPYGFLSNFSLHQVFMEGVSWLTVEHFYQAGKFQNTEIRNFIKSLDSPQKAAKEGESRKHLIRSDWDTVKEKIMFTALMAKFLQHPQLRRELLNTESSILIEDVENDSYFGNGGNDTERNKLGYLLMHVREAIKALDDDKDLVLPPWIAFPGMSQFDGFWRMGWGEDYITTWGTYYLNCENKDDYKRKFPEQAEWEGAYE